MPRVQGGTATLQRSPVATHLRTSPRKKEKKSVRTPSPRKRSTSHPGQPPTQLGSPAGASSPQTAPRTTPATPSSSIGSTPRGRSVTAASISAAATAATQPFSPTQVAYYIDGCLEQYHRDALLESFKNRPPAANVSTRMFMDDEGELSQPQEGSVAHQSESGPASPAPLKSVPEMTELLKRGIGVARVVRSSASSSSFVKSRAGKMKTENRVLYLDMTHNDNEVLYLVRSKPKALGDVPNKKHRTTEWAALREMDPASIEVVNDPDPGGTGIGTPGFSLVFPDVRGKRCSVELRLAACSTATRDHIVNAIRAVVDASQWKRYHYEVARGQLRRYKPNAGFDCVDKAYELEQLCSFASGGGGGAAQRYVLLTFAGGTKLTLRAADATAAAKWLEALDCAYRDHKYARAMASSSSPLYRSHAHDLAVAAAETPPSAVTAHVAASSPLSPSPSSRRPFANGSDVGSLTGRELRAHLARLGVDTRECIERADFERKLVSHFSATDDERVGAQMRETVGGAQIEATARRHEVWRAAHDLNLELPTTPVAPTPSATVGHGTPHFGRGGDVDGTIEPWHLAKIVRIGRGASGVVWKVVDARTMRLYALKEVSTSERWTRGRAQVDDELAALQQLQASGQSGKEHFVRLHAAFPDQDASTLSLVMEYASGGSLQDLLNEPTVCVNEAALAHIAWSIASGLHCLHRDRKMHRDLKPANVLVDHYGCVKIADFGLAKQMEGRGTAANEGEGEASTLGPGMGAETYTGTPAYMSPERLDGREYSMASDVWALGLVLAAVALKLHPLGGGGPNANIWDVQDRMSKLWHRTRADAPQFLRVGLPTRFSATALDFVHSCLCCKPCDRPAASKLLKHHFVQGAGLAAAASPPRDVPVADPPPGVLLDELDDVLVAVVRHRADAGTLTANLPPDDAIETLAQQLALPLHSVRSRLRELWAVASDKAAGTPDGHTRSAADRGAAWAY